MAKDTRSFFERLTGSVKIQDAGGGEDGIKISDALSAETETENEEEIKIPAKSDAGKLSKRKIVRETEAAENKPAKTSSFFRAGAKKREEERKIPEEKKAPDYGLETKKTAVAESEKEPENEVEGQLTVDIYDDGENIVVQSTVAGVKPEDLDVTILNDMVTIKGKRKKQQEVKDENYYYRELYWGSFSRSIILQEEVESEKAEASLKNGLLTVKLPKKNKNIIQKIRVKTE